MPAEILFEQRLSAVEAAVLELQQRVLPSAGPESWLKQVIGTFKDEPAFEEVLAHGREFRAEDRPRTNDEP